MHQKEEWASFQGKVSWGSGSLAMSVELSLYVHST